ncbi:hypothetical protein [Hwanghaeella sp.]|uniref:hypothetical protein n=1 Tax=Hwanghaeella sp. TaxID=2605943 RepID=UPI003CCBE0E3
MPNDFERFFAEAGSDTRRSQSGSPSYETFFTEQDRTQRQTVARSLQVIEGVSPDAAGEARRAGTALGLPSSFVERNLKTLGPMADNAGLRKRLEGSTTVADFFADAENAKLASDDTENLTTLESLWRYGTNALKRGALGVRQGFNQFLAEDAAERAGDEDKSFLDIFGEAAGEDGFLSPLDAFDVGRRFGASRFSEGNEQAAQEALETVGRISDRIASIEMSPPATRALQAMQAVDDQGFVAALEALTEDPAGALALIAETAVESTPQLAASAGATALTRNPAAGVAVLGGSSFALERYRSPAEFLADRGIDLSDPDQVEQVLGDKDLLREAQQFGFTRGAIIGAFDLASGGLASKTLAKSLFVDLLAQTVAQGGLGGGGEGLAQLATTGEVKPSEVILEALAEFATAPIEATAVGGKYLAEARQARQATGAKAAQDAVDAAAEASKLRQRAPDKFGEVNGKMMREQGVEAVSIPAEEMQRFMQTAPDAGNILAELGVEDQYQEALAIGGDVEITPEAFSEHIIGTPRYEALADHLRISPDAMTAAEAEVYARDEVQREFEAVGEPDTSAVIETEAQIIQREVEAQLEAVGEAPQNAMYQATLIAQRYATRAERSGASALALWRDDNVTIRGAEPRASFNEDTRVLDVLRSGRTPEETLGLSSRPVLDVLAETGGVDPAGDLAAELRALDVTPQTRPNLFRNGGIGSGDNLVASEIPVFAERDFGDETNGYVPIDAIVEAVREELAGRPLRTQDQAERVAAIEAEIADLRERLEAVGIDETADDKVIRRALASNLEQTDQDASQDSPTGDEARGSIEFANAAVFINLGKNADRSTFLHESGHLFLEQLREDAADFRTEQLTKDWETIVAWWASNAESLKAEAIALARRAKDTEAVAALEAMPLDAVKDFIGQGDLSRTGAEGYIGTAMHEQWARGTEDYFRTGEAPSVALQDAFNRFRAWLVSIYRAMKRRLSKEALDVAFSDDVKAVMDRLLASDEEIALVEEQYDLKALFGSAEEIGMTPAQFSDYQRAVARASEEAKSRQLKKHLSEIEREKLAWWKDERAKLRAEVEQEVAQSPTHRAVAALTSGASPTGDILPVRPNRLSKAAIVDIYGSPETLKRLPRVRGKAVYATSRNESGASPDLVAQMFGFKDGRAMLDAMVDAPTFREAVDTETDNRMHQLYGDMLNDGTAVEKALESAHADKRGDVLTMELNALRQSKDRIKPAFVRTWARQRIGEKRIDAIQPSRFLAQERRWAREAGRQLRAGNRLEAQRAKFRQLMNFHMAQEAYRVRDEVSKAKRYAGKFTKRKAVFKGIDAEYVDKIRAILGAYRFGPRLSSRRELLLEMQAMADWIKQKQEDDGAVLTIPPEILAARETTNYRDLTLNEFRTLIDSLKNIEAQGRLRKRLRVGAEERDIDAVASDILSRIERLPDNARSLRAEARQNPTKLDKAKAGLAAADAALRKAEFMIEAMDGERLGPMHQALFQPFADAQARAADMTKAVTDKVNKMLRDLPEDVRGRLSEDIEVPALDRTFQRSDLIMMALNVGNESNLDKMLRGSARDAFGGQAWTAEGVDQALANLSREEWEFVQGVWDSFEEMWPAVAEIHRAENGVAPERVEPRTIKTAYGEFRGGYYPMQYDPARSQAARELESKTALEAMQSEAVAASVNSSMTKGRTGFAAPVNLNIEALTNGIDRTVHYVTHYEAVRGARKLLARPDLQKAITRKLGPEYYDELKQWVGAVATNGQDQRAYGWWNRAFEVMRTNATIAIMGFSYTTMSAQLLGYANTIDGLARQSDGRYTPGKATVEIGSAMVAYMRRPKAMTRDVFAASGEMRHRLGNINRELTDALKEARGRKGYWAGFQRFSLEVIGRVQLYGVDIPTWTAAYNVALKDGRTADEAVQFADSVIRTTQTAGAVKDLANIQRQRGVMRVLTMFYSYFNLLYNIAAQSVGETRRVADVPKLAARTLIVIAIPAVLDALRNQEGPDEDEDGEILDEDPGTWLQWAGVRSLTYLTGAVPVLGPAVNAGTRGFTPTLSPIEQFGEGATEGLAKLARDIDKGEISATTLKSLATVIGFGIGAPSVQVNRFIDAVDAMADGEDVGPVDFLTGFKD